jgi:septal ring factor EnvC (AmiA/AmiB activator)
MSETRPGNDPAARLERDAAELDHRLQRLDGHISEAERAAEARREEANPGEAVAGDWEDTKGTAGQGEDPEGAPRVREDSPESDDADSGDARPGG